MTVKLSGQGVTGTANPKGYRTRNSDMAVWSTVGVAFETYNAANIANYGIVAAEQGVTGVFSFTDPADTTPGRFRLIASAGASLTVADVANNTFWEDSCGVVGLTAAEIDTTLTASHGAGAWTTSPSAGSGAWTITITVNDGAAVLEGAIVRLTKGADSYSVATNASGIAVFTINSGTWTVAIALGGYTFTQTTLVVSATASQTYSMTVVSITQSDPGMITGYLFARNVSGTVQAGIVVYYKLTRLATGATGTMIDGTTRSGTSIVTGKVELLNMLPGATYDIWTGNQVPVSETIPAAAASTYALLSQIRTGY